MSIYDPWDLSSEDTAMADFDWRPATLAVVAGRGTRGPGDPVNAPITLSAPYLAGPDGLGYGRDQNATWSALEEAIGQLEGGHAVGFASGMAATAAIISRRREGDLVVVQADAYSGTRRLLELEAGRGLLALRLVDFGDRRAIARAVARAALVWIDSPSNPLLALTDIAAVAKRAHAAGAEVAVDNTLATPMLQRPLALGADFVVHSATKLISGAADVVLGVAVAADRGAAEELRLQRSARGAIPGPFETYLALRGLRSLRARLDRAQATALLLAGRLDHHPQVTLVRYPGFASPRDRRIVRSQMQGTGTILSFEVAGGVGQADAICRGLELVRHATSLGGPETTIERRAAAGAEPLTPTSLLRLSVGQEDAEDVWADLDRALRMTA
jgi:cystathionine gamma-synthase